MKLRKENEMLKDKMDNMGEQMKEMFVLVKEMIEKAKV
jgi:hypothetical protein